MSNMLVVTSIFASALTLIYLVLSLKIMNLRGNHKVRLGDGGIDELQRAIRAHGNFSEYVPLGLILLGCLEGNGAPWWITVPLGSALVAGRVIHATGMNEPQNELKYRVIGMKFTFNTLLVMLLLNVCLAISRIVSSNIT
jgi:uncharacterized membrane protein YecN with MAPEG domain